ncbi:acyltransferase family protein [Brevundimonas subvibrioides]|uniref:acyltransferase family protein n=1 Tax=Brevundimonas subvibrioides TaxID=74313 RepID=UPI003CCA71E8
MGWTLIFEMFFYALFTLALLLRLRVLPFLAVVLSLCAIGALFRQPDWPAWTVYLNMRVLEFLAGMLIAQHLSHRKAPLWVPLAALVGGFILILFAPSAGGGLGEIITLVLPASLVVCGAVALEPHFKGRFPSWVIFLGAASYSLYLIHPIAAPVVPQVLGKLGFTIGWLSVAGSITAAICAAIFTYFLFEKPVTKWLARAFASGLRREA